MVYNDKKFKFDPEIKQVIAANIRKFRLEKGYTQEQLSELIDISQKALSSIETGEQLAVYTERSPEFVRRIESELGERGFSIETLYRISVVLEKDVGEFFKKNNK